MDNKVNCYPLIFKQRIIYAYKYTNNSAQYIAKLFGISKTSIFNWLKLFKNNNLT